MPLVSVYFISGLLNLVISTNCVTFGNRNAPSFLFERFDLFKRLAGVNERREAVESKHIRRDLPQEMMSSKKAQNMGCIGE